jgi:hypothetical protein
LSETGTFENRTTQIGLPQIAVEETDFAQLSSSEVDPVQHGHAAEPETSEIEWGEVLELAQPIELTLPG